MKKSTLVVVSFLFVALIFFAGNFVFVKSHSTSNAATGIAKAGNISTFKDGFCVYPDSYFRKLVAEELRNEGHKVKLLEEPKECDGQFLAVWIEEINLTYTPIKSSGAVRVIAIYSSIGRPKHYLEYINSENKTAALKSFVGDVNGEVQAYTIITVRDSSWGIMSLRGYQDYLLKLAAREIVKAIDKISQR
ncbi:hypothetical protein [Thermococcus paralvinellae]|uniref:Uncharacterized protein n=1 Tax=Thermococcus paralvinellae TaxID=582419 RepID=W0I2I7_9EURY|nr:hypothetical protein [Thermococcus paralvinellae]AHF80266.1 Hypothetical protein TES1_0880 [Thermococcus paralvinellae]